MNLAVIDLETDPFEHARMIYPFVAGFYDGKTFRSYWGDDCVDRLVEYLDSLDDTYTIYAHNGGRFDYFYFMNHIERDLRIVNNRIIQAWLGKHELRDSFAIMPFALEKYHKTEIDYSKFTRENREKHRAEIIAYLKDDCTDLFTLVTEFIAEFGNNLTIGGAGMKQLKKFHSFDTGNGIYDARLRKDFYFGGRNQVFKSGIIQGPIRVYDVNSMYSSVMRDYLHPVSTGLYMGTKIDNRTCFLTVEGRNFGAFPVRLKDNSLDFTQEFGTFNTTIHEYKAAMDTGCFITKRIIRTIGFSRRESFGEFVDHFSNKRVQAKIDEDKIHVLFYKYVLNAPYGKFAQNPENYCDWFITEAGEFPKEWHECDKACDEPCKRRWTPAFISGNDYIIWSRPLLQHNYYNVATGASITGAARAVLLRGIHAAIKPYYCDTDSVICHHMDGVEIHHTKLGAWDIEAEGTSAAICGKKLYAIFDADGKCIKKAHKGARLQGYDILKIAKGGTVESINPVPSFKWDGTHTFTKRKIRSTA